MALYVSYETNRDELKKFGKREFTVTMKVTRKLLNNATKRLCIQCICYHEDVGEVYVNHAMIDERRQFMGHEGQWVEAKAKAHVYSKLNKHRMRIAIQDVPVKSTHKPKQSKLNHYINTRPDSI